LVAAVGGVLALAGCAQFVRKDVVLKPAPTLESRVLLPPVVGKQEVTWTSPLAVSCQERAWVLERPVASKAPARLKQQERCQ
jgi:hypothetical protein